MVVINLVGYGAWGKHILRDLLTLNCWVCVIDTDSRARMEAIRSVLQPNTPPWRPRRPATGTS